MKFLSALALLVSTQAFAQELTLYFAPSPKGIDWSSPAKLVKSALENRLTFEKRFIGHVFVELDCGTPVLTSMTAGRFDYLKQLVFNGSGLGILYHSFEGELENETETRPELKKALDSGTVSFARFKLNDGLCKRATQYLTEYREKNVGKNYGLANSPRLGEGAGCSAYAVSFLDVLGVLDQDMKESWSHSVKIPLSYAGAPLTDDYVGLHKFFLEDVKWAQDQDKHVTLSFWSPDKMHAWVLERRKQKQTHFDIMKIGKAIGLVYDKSRYPTPEEPIWLQRLSTDKKTVAP